MSESQEYRAYLIGPDGRIQRCIELVCGCEDAARARAEQLVDGHDIELWSGERFVIRLDRREAGKKPAIR